MTPKLENPQTFVRSIKGAPASILIALLFVKRPMEAQELEDWTGFSDDNITKGLRFLVTLGWIVAIGTRGPWALSDQGRQLPLVNFFDGDESEKIGLEPIIITYGSEKNLYSGNNNKDLPSPKKSDSGRNALTPQQHLNPNFEACLMACKAGGVIEPTASRIADLFDHLGKPITPEFIRAHLAAAGRENRGLAIRRIESFDMVPRPEEGNRRNDLVNKLRGKSEESEEGIE